MCSVGYVEKRTRGINLPGYYPYPTLLWVRYGFHARTRTLVCDLNFIRSRTWGTGTKSENTLPDTSVSYVQHPYPILV